MLVTRNSDSAYYNLINFAKNWVQDTIIINSTKYYNVYINEMTSYFGHNGEFPLICVFGKNVGLLERELQNGEKWELITYKINQ
jgi:hypothetical protein